MGSHLISPSSFLYFLDSSYSYPQLYAFFMQINSARLSFLSVLLLPHYHDSIQKGPRIQNDSISILPVGQSTRREHGY